jgi:hypothetical protein
MKPKVREESEVSMPGRIKKSVPMGKSRGFIYQKRLANPGACA